MSKVMHIQYILADGLFQNRKNSTLQARFTLSKNDIYTQKFSNNLEHSGYRDLHYIVSLSLDPVFQSNSY